MNNDSTYVRDARGPYFTQVYHYEVDDYFQRIERKRRAHAIAVYVVVARHASHKVSSFPSLSRIMELSGLSRATVVEALKELKRVGLISVTKRTNRRGQATNLYELVSSGDELTVSSSPELEEDTEEKKSVEANASRPKAKSVGLEKYIVDGIYQAMRQANLRLPNEHFKYHLGRAKDVLEKDSPTDREIEELPAAFVRLWQIKGRADAHSALMEMRRQEARARILAENSYEPRHPQSEKPKRALTEQERREQEELERLEREAVKAVYGG